MKTSCLRWKLVELNFFASFTTADQSIFYVSNTLRSLLNTPMPHQTPIRTNTPPFTPGTQQRAHQQTPVRSKPISKQPISPAQSVSRKLIQKSMKLLNAPKHKLVSRPCPDVTSNVKPFPLLIYICDIQGIFSSILNHFFCMCVPHLMCCIRTHVHSQFTTS